MHTSLVWYSKFELRIDIHKNHHFPQLWASFAIPDSLSFDWTDFISVSCTFLLKGIIFICSRFHAKLEADLKYTLFNFTFIKDQSFKSKLRFYIFKTFFFLSNYYLYLIWNIFFPRFFNFLLDSFGDIALSFSSFRGFYSFSGFLTWRGFWLLPLKPFSFCRFCFSRNLTWKFWLPPPFWSSFSKFWAFLWFPGCKFLWPFGNMSPWFGRFTGESYRHLCCSINNYYNNIKFLGFKLNVLNYVK